MTRGFLIPAQNTISVDYVNCATVLAQSIKRVMPNEKVAILTDDPVPNDIFDYVIPLPYGDLAPNSEWKLINDCQVYQSSPFDQTIKLEADMYVPCNIDYWFDLMALNHVTVCSKIRNFKNELSDSMHYRKILKDNNLPSVYNAITYFDKSDFSKEFFDIVNEVFNNWDDFKEILKCNVDEPCTTDWAYSIACHIMGEQTTTLPSSDISLIHMKKHINMSKTENWIDELMFEIHPETIRIQTYPQMYPFHYRIKSFANIIQKELNDI